jgi:hypothetical protein
MIKRRLKHSPIEWPEEMARKYREVVDEERQQESSPVRLESRVRMHEEMQDLIKNPAAEQNDHPSPSGAIRSLVDRGLKAKKLRNRSYQSG